MKKRFIVFDFDGTLFNTNEVIVKSWQAATKKYLGYEMDRKDILATFGETLSHTVSYLMPNEDVMEVCNFHSAYQEAHLQGLVSVFEGVPELLAALKQRGCGLAVATSRRKESFYKYMDAFNLINYFDATIVMEDVTHHKPHPESLLVAMNKLGADPEETLMVGDTKYDMICAINAGVECAMVRWSHYIDDEELERSRCVPNYNLNEPADLLKLV